MIRLDKKELTKKMLRKYLLKKTSIRKIKKHCKIIGIKKIKTKKNDEIDKRKAAKKITEKLFDINDCLDIKKKYFKEKVFNTFEPPRFPKKKPICIIKNYKAQLRKFINRFAQNGRVDIQRYRKFGYIPYNYYQKIMKQQKDLKFSKTITNKGSQYEGKYTYDIHYIHSFKVIDGVENNNLPNFVDSRRFYKIIDEEKFIYKILITSLDFRYNISEEELFITVRFDKFSKYEEEEDSSYMHCC